MPWTRAAVEGELIAAFRMMKDCPVFSAGSASRLTTAHMSQGDRQGRNALTDVLDWRRFLDGDADAYLLAWARCKATKSSFAEVCREMGWRQSNAERGRRRGADTIVAALNATFRQASNADHTPGASLATYTKKSLDFDKGGIGALPDIAAVQQRGA